MHEPVNEADSKAIEMAAASDQPMSQCDDCQELIPEDEAIVLGFGEEGEHIVVRCGWC